MTRLDYAWFLLTAQRNYTLTYFADHHESLSHGTINRFTSSDKLTPRLAWDNVKDEIDAHDNGYLENERDDVTIDFELLTRQVKNLLLAERCRSFAMR
ncbi:MAG: hypothetical protein RhofKO_17280 [Rhodothermales bacterium]